MLRTETFAQAGAFQPPSKSARAFAWANARLEGYLPALAAFVAAIALHGLAVSLVGSKVVGAFAFSLYVVTLLVAAWCGYGPGILVTLLITCFMPYLFKPGFSVRHVDIGAVTVFLLLSVLVSGTASGRRRTEALLLKVNQELDKRVHEQTRILEQQLAELETLYAELSVGLCFLDTDLRFVRVNDKFASLNDSSAHAYSGRDFREVVSEAFADAVEPLFRRTLLTEEPVFEREVALGGADRKGAGRFWWVSCSRVATDGRVLGLQVVVQDISERKQAEVDLSESNRRLRRANEDLEQFAFSASHDLQEPLRIVTLYTQMLKRKFAGELGPDGDEYIGYTVRSAGRMQQLVGDLLDYLQASPRDAVAVEPASATEALEQALSNLHAGIVEAQASITTSELPSITVRKAHLVQLFQNLLGNALKYRDNERPLRIHVGVVPHQGDSNWLFSVKDNGIGIDREYHQQVFGIFKRLHPYEEYPGTGMGLAICRRIVEQYGGRIWVDSKLGEGATFLFTVPAAPSRGRATLVT
jgi:PAS domain S-box-containing protein